MIKSCSVMGNVNRICQELREVYFGEQATANDFKDSYVINQAIANFSDSPTVLMEEDITSKEKQSEGRISKSINFRSNCYEKIKIYSKQIHISESETLRRLLYYSLKEKKANQADTLNSAQITALKAKAELLKTQIEMSAAMMNDIMDAIAELESKGEDTGE